MEWNGIEWGGTDNLPHFFLLILRAFESFFGAVEFNSGVEVRSYALPIFQMKLQTVYALYFGRTSQSPTATLIPLIPAQSSLGADILVYWIGKIVRTCAPGVRSLKIFVKVI